MNRMQEANAQPLDHQVLALAGIFLVATQVDTLARRGTCNKDDFRALISSLFVTNPDRVEDIYDSGLQVGYEALIQFLEMGKKSNSAIYGYVLGLFYLQKKLTRSPEMLSLIGTRIDKARQQLAHFGIHHENLIANLAGIYTDTLSTFTFRIQVKGEMTYLQQPRIANDIRALLLAGIRAATLWRQMGGRRWHLLFRQRALLATAEKHLCELRKSP